MLYFFFIYSFFLLQILGQTVPKEKMNNVDATCNAIMEASQALESNIQLCCGHCTGIVKYV